jgi:hypothetical protein
MPQIWPEAVVGCPDFTFSRHFPGGQGISQAGSHNARATHYGAGSHRPPKLTKTWREKMPPGSAACRAGRTDSRQTKGPAAFLAALGSVQKTPEANRHGKWPEKLGCHSERQRAGVSSFYG